MPNYSTDPADLAEAASQLIEDLQTLPPGALEHQPIPRAALLAAVVRSGRCIGPTSLRRRLAEWIVRLQQDALVDRDRSGYLQWLAHDVRFEDSSAPPLRGHAAVGRFIDELMAKYEKAEFKHRALSSYPQHVVHVEQWWDIRVAMTFEMEITPHGGPAFTIAGVDAFEFDGSLHISRLTSFYPLTR